MATQTTSQTQHRGKYNRKGRFPRRGGVVHRKACRFCVDKVQHVDFKAVNLLKSFVTDRGKMLSSRTTGVCTWHQRQLQRAIKRAQFLALLPYTAV